MLFAVLSCLQRANETAPSESSDNGVSCSSNDQACAVQWAKVVVSYSIIRSPALFRPECTTFVRSCPPVRFPGERLRSTVPYTRAHTHTHIIYLPAYILPVITSNIIRFHRVGLDGGNRASSFCVFLLRLHFSRRKHYFI